MYSEVVIVKSYLFISLYFIHFFFYANMKNTSNFGHKKPPLSTVVVNLGGLEPPTF